MIMGLTTRSCRLGGTISGRMKQWQLSGSTVGCATGLPASGDGPALCRKRARWSTPPSHCLPPTTSIEQRQNSPCHCLLNTLRSIDWEMQDAGDGRENHVVAKTNSHKKVNEWLIHGGCIVIIFSTGGYLFLEVLFGAS